MEPKASAVREVGGPFYDDLSIGDRFDGAPALTLTSGLAAAHQAIVGSRLRLALDHDLARRVTGSRHPSAHPALVWDVSIGQSTLATQRVVANLFYRGLLFRSFPSIGDTLRTRTEVVGLRPVAPRPDRPPRGLAVLRIATVDKEGRSILDFHRCAMLPARRLPGRAQAGLLDPPGAPPEPGDLAAAVEDWDLAAFRASAPGPHFADVLAGSVYRLAGGDVVGSAPELARLTLNLAAVHHDRSVTGTGERLVYGGHTIGIAAHQVTRTLPALVTILAWHSCEHLAPVYEGDTLLAEVEVERCQALAQGGGLVHLRCRVRATRRDNAQADVLDWRLVGLLA